tara:strand:+ start:903 stop:1094 length:192 start_codon:yes stop_codon:yes gene_type:complete
MKLNKKELEEVIVNTKINLQKARIASDYKIRKNSWTYENRKEIKERVVFLEGILTKLKKTGDE